MAAKTSIPLPYRRGDRTILVAFWVLGIFALLEITLAAFALAPRFVAAVRSNATSDQTSASDSGATTAATSSPGNESQVTSHLKNPSSSSPQFSGNSHSRDGTILGQDAANNSHSDTENPSDAPLSIVSSKLEGTGDSNRKLIVAIKARAKESIEVPQVKVQIYFYDSSDGEIVPSKAQVTSNWLSLPVAWKDGGPEILEVNYLMDSIDQGVSFSGYVVAVYYKGELQDYRAEPSKLTKLFPLKYFIGTDES